MYKNSFIKLTAFTALLSIATTSYAQLDAAKAVQTRLEQYSNVYLQEKLYMHTDKDFYLAGEVAWFKLYCVNASTHKPSTTSKVAYVEVIDRSLKPVLQAKIELTEKGGSGSFYLPLTLRSDQYSIRAYTSWMKNAGSQVFFEKHISIVNTLKQLDAGTQSDSNRIATEFFPEGGYLVQDVETNLAFRSINQYGKGVMAAGVIVSDLGDTVTTFKPEQFGIGSFRFRPVAGRQYKAIVTGESGRSFTSSLPSVYASGYVMNITDNIDGRYKVRIQARRANSEQRGEKVFLLVHTRQVTKKVEYGFANYETDLVFFVDKSALGDGVSHFTLFNEAQQPVAERLIFRKPTTQGTVQLASDKGSYGKREAVQLSLSNMGKVDSAAYSLAVIQQDGLQGIDPQDIGSYLWLVSDLQGEVESPGYYLQNTPEAVKAADNLMLTHGWRRFRWESMLSANKNVTGLNAIPETMGHVIKARVTRPDGQVAANVDCYLSFPSTPFGLYVSKTDADGLVYFNIKKYYGPGEIIVQADPFHANNYRVDVQTPFTDEQLANPIPFLAVSKANAAMLTQRSIAMQSQNLYRPDSLRRFTLPSFEDTLPFYGRPEFAYNLDEYKRFNTMEEVLREYVSSINVAPQNGKPVMSMWDEKNMALYKDNILVLLDGVPLKDYNKIFTYDPFKVKRLEVVPRRYLMGPFIFSGIASFETYNGKFDAFDLDPAIIAVDYEGLQLKREFYSPSYGSAADRNRRIPDFRTTLFWNPDASTTQSFYTSDQTGKFQVILQGINHKGETVTATTSFEVK